MLIKIKRIYINDGSYADILINTRYISTISPTNDISKPKTRIIMEGFSQEDRGQFIYTDESIKQIKAKITRSRKTTIEEE